MRLVSVNIGQARPISSAGKSGVTGIFKEPKLSLVQITTLGLADDDVCDTEHHGGEDQAVYVYGVEDYAWWQSELGRPLAPGTFGENLTISGLESAERSIGDRFHIRDVILEVTAPRIPCGTLAARMGDRDFPKRFQLAERPGLYCRVIQEGSVCAGDDVALEPYTGDTIAAIEMFRDFYRKDQDEATLRRYLAAPIAVRARVYLEGLLERMRATNSAPESERPAITE